MMNDAILSNQELKDDDEESLLGGSRDKKSRHQRLVFTDPAAFRYLEEDPSTTVLERRRRLTGYELYCVEQWACSRKHPTFVITTYTGLEQHSVLTSVLGVPTDEDLWSPRLRVYLRAVKKYHARAKETPLGTLMVTNLSNFPSALTVINVPDGDLKAHRDAFIINEDLKRLGCTGRAGLNLETPIPATEAKFRDLFKVNDRIPLNAAVVELVKLTQAALMLYGLLPIEYADGMLCDVTEQKISDWWAEIGGDYFNTDPTDGILGPTTVAAMLGLLMGARNRLHAAGISVSKDVFDISSIKRAISSFQKAQRMERTRRLDRKTLDRLRKVTAAKAASSENSAVPRVVKSTVAELSGKGASLVHARERTGIADVESIDMEDFISLGFGDRFKWLWQGKPKKHDEKDALKTFGDSLAFDDQDGGLLSRKKSTDDDFGIRHAFSDRFYQSSYGSSASLDHLPPDQALRRAALKNMAGKTEQKKLGKIRSVMPRRTHTHSNLKYSDLDQENVKEGIPRQSYESTNNQSTSSQVEKLSQKDRISQDSSRKSSKGEHHSSQERIRRRDPSRSSVDNDSSGMDSVVDLMNHADGVTTRQGRPTLERERTMTATDMQAIDKMEHFGWASSNMPRLRSTKSLSTIIKKTTGKNYDQRFPRRSSFSPLEDILHAGSYIETDESNTLTALALETELALKIDEMEEKLFYLKTMDASWVEAKVSQIEAFDHQFEQTHVRMDEVYHQRVSVSHEVQDMVQHLLSDKKTSVNEAVKDVENLDAKLEYEMQALQSKVEDMEDGVDEFERQIVQLESKADELDHKGPQRSWLTAVLGLGLL